MPGAPWSLIKTVKPSVQKGLQYKGTVALPNGKVLQIRGMNRERIAGDLVLYNRNYGHQYRD
jgi:hypothetical protein